MPAPNSIPAILERFGQRAVDSMRKAMIRAGIDEGSNLVASVDFSVRFYGSEYVFSLTMNDYGTFVDRGRRPTPPGAPRHNPSLREKLAGPRGWIARKGIAVPMRVTIKRKTKDGIKPYIKTFKNRKEANASLASAIATSIHRKGYRAKPFKRKGLTPKMIAGVQRELSQTFARQVMVEIRQTFTPPK